MRIMMISNTAREYYSDQAIEDRERTVLSYARPGTEIVFDYIDKGKCAGYPSATQCDMDFVAPWIAKKAKEAEEAGFDAVIPHAIFDIGVDTARQFVNIPVVPMGRATVHVAAMLADKIGLLAPHDVNIPAVRRLLRIWGMESLFTPIRGINIPTQEVRAHLEENRERVIHLSRLAVEDGAEIIIPFCPIYVPMFLSAKEVEDAVGVPVLDGYACSIRFAEMLVALGVRHSPKTYPPHQAYRQLLAELV